MLESAAVGEVSELACEAAGMEDVPPEDRPLLVTDQGRALISRDFGDYLEAHGPVVMHACSRLSVAGAGCNSRGVDYSKWGEIGRFWAKSLAMGATGR